MKCTKCGKELGQKNICPVCNGKNIDQTETPEQFPVAVYGKNENAELQLCQNSSLPSDDSVRIRFQQFLDANCYDWEVTFERNFADREYDFYARAFEACKALWEVREFLLASIRATDAERITPLFMIQVMKHLREKFPEYPLEAARKWLTDLFYTERRRADAFEAFARSFQKGDPGEMGEMIYVFPDVKDKDRTENSLTDAELSTVSTDEDRPEKTTLTRPVWVQNDFVRIELWKKIIQGENQSVVAGGNTFCHPTWNEAMHFCKALTAYCRKKGSIPEDYAYTLPDKALCQFIKGKNILSAKSTEWLWDGPDGSADKLVAIRVGTKDTEFGKRHRDSRSISLFFRVVLAPLRPGCVWDDAETDASSDSSGGAGYGLNSI